jgi:hypothetical protein
VTSLLRADADDARAPDFRGAVDGLTAANHCLAVHNPALQRGRRMGWCWDGNPHRWLRATSVESRYAPAAGA